MIHLYSSNVLLSDVPGLAGFARLCAGDQYEVRNTNTSM